MSARDSSMVKAEAVHKSFGAVDVPARRGPRSVRRRPRRSGRAARG
ncbi:hypothetical protein [Streptomyces cacaoi]